MAIIRPGTENDLSATLKLIKELAVFERAPNAVIVTEEQLKQDGFGKNPLYGLLVAEEEGSVVGISLYYNRYSTWKGKCLYLEDLIVTEEHRGKGIGLELFLATKKVAKETGCYKMVWQVLDWNTPAIDFYKQQGADIDPEWYNCEIVV